MSGASNTVISRSAARNTSYSIHYTKLYDPQAGNTFPPANNRFTTFAADGYAVIHDESFIGDNRGDKIICNYSDISRKVLDYNVEAKNGNPGWYFAKSANDLQPSYWVLDLFIIKIKLPSPTPWIVVYGPPADIAPMSYDIDREA